MVNRIMRKALLSVLVLGAMFLSPNPANSAPTCEMSKYILKCIVENTSDPTFYDYDLALYAADKCISGMPALTQQAARNFIDTYFPQAFELLGAMYTPEEVAITLALCEGDAPCSTCELMNPPANSIINIDNGKRTTSRETGYCKVGCTCPTPCPDRVTYSCTCNSGYEVYRQGSSDCFCDKKYCVAGQYLNSSNNCVNCPTASGFSPTSEEWTVVITGCYIPKDSASSDSKGGYKYTSDCYYVQ